MKGNNDVIELLNAVLTSELTAINQYFIHYKMCEDWGFHVLAQKKRSESLEEMQHANSVIGRILFLEGTPNMQRLFPVKVGEDPIEQHRLDLELELEACKRLNDGIALCREKGDNGSREILAWLTASLRVPAPLVTGMTSVPSRRIRSTLRAWRSMSTSPM